MPTRIYIYGYTPFGSIQRLMGLEDALVGLLQDLGRLEVNLRRYKLGVMQQKR
jgi:hypothetical protein